ncbi:hypothetical protein ABZ070_12305 [Streptomyces sp. NPDC006283]|uniref:hypothetical protein n=1 Tax=Streptomyces sp. NPDC006283 TaxID=3156741 RepID=UPI0033AF064B
MASPALTTAVDRVRAVFSGMTSPGETGCGRCHLPEETALLGVPDVELPGDVLEMFAREVPGHFDDHPAAMRRILPQLAERLAARRFGSLNAYDLTGLGRSGWRTWPGEQRDAIGEFLDAWWADTVSTPLDVSYVLEVFQACVTAGLTVTPYLATWAAQPTGGPADAYLEAFVAWWIEELLWEDTQVISWWCDHTRDEPDAELRAWVLEHAPARLRARGADPLLLFRTGLLALPREQRFTEETWAGAPV